VSESFTRDLYRDTRPQESYATATARPYVAHELTRQSIVNDRGETVGFYDDANSNFHGFLRSRRGHFTSVDAPGGELGTAPASINDRGEMVGATYNADGSPDGFFAAARAGSRSSRPPGRRPTPVPWTSTTTATSSATTTPNHPQPTTPPRTPGPSYDRSLRRGRRPGRVEPASHGHDTLGPGTGTEEPASGSCAAYLGPGRSARDVVLVTTTDRGPMTARAPSGRWTYGNGLG
jgi:hypothetical protein